MDLYDPSSGEQVHDFNADIADSGLFWTIQIPDSALTFSKNLKTATLHMEDVAIIDNWHVLGLRGTGSDSYRLDDHFVPQRYTAGRDNEAERHEPGPLYQFTSGMIYAMSFAHVSMGIARGAYDAFIEIARDKVPRGAKGTLREGGRVICLSSVAGPEAPSVSECTDACTSSVTV